MYRVCNSFFIDNVADDPTFVMGAADWSPNFV